MAIKYTRFVVRRLKHAESKLSSFKLRSVNCKWLKWLINYKNHRTSQAYRRVKFLIRVCVKRVKVASEGWNQSSNVTGRLTGEIVTCPTFQFLALPISLPSSPCLSFLSLPQFLKLCTSFCLSSYDALFSLSQAFSCLYPLASLAFHIGFLVISLSLCVSVCVSISQAFFHLFTPMFNFNVFLSSCPLLLLSVLQIQRASMILSL